MINDTKVRFLRKNANKVVDNIGGIVVFLISKGFFSFDNNIST